MRPACAAPCKPSFPLSSSLQASCEKPGEAVRVRNVRSEQEVSRFWQVSGEVNNLEREERKERRLRRLRESRIRKRPEKKPKEL